MMLVRTRRPQLRARLCAHVRLIDLLLGQGASISIPLRVQDIYKWRGFQSYWTFAFSIA